jgi:hypothetical protein
VEASHPEGAVPVVVKPFIPGAQVMPDELRLEPGKSVTFQVTPLAKGRLTQAHLEVHQPSRPTLLLPLKIKVGSQRFTWIMLLLTLLLPGLMAYFTDPMYGKLKGQIEKDKIIAVGGSATQPGRGQVTGEKVLRDGQPGEILAYHLDRIMSRNLPDVLGADNRLALGQSLNDFGASVGLPGPLDARRSLLAGILGGIYQFLCGLEAIKPAFILAVALGLITIASWFMFGSRRSWFTKYLDVSGKVESPRSSPAAPLSSPPPTAPLNVRGDE